MCWHYKRRSLGQNRYLDKKTCGSQDLPQQGLCLSGKTVRNLPVSLHCLQSAHRHAQDQRGDWKFSAGLQPEGRQLGRGGRTDEAEPIPLALLEEVRLCQSFEDSNQPQGYR